MRVLQIYNQYRSRGGGEAAVVMDTISLLREHGHEVRLLERDSSEIQTVMQKVVAAIDGVYSVSARRLVSDGLRNWRPDVVHVHNLYPRFSPSILLACRREQVPVVMTVHNYNLTCPTWYHLYKGRVCEECVGGREHRCVIKNCRNNILESFAYAIRSSVARRFRLFHDNVSVLIALTPFSRDRLMKVGFREHQIAVVPNSVSPTHTVAKCTEGSYVAFAGRISPEKGTDTLLAAAARMPDVPFKVAGEGPGLSEMIAKGTPNVEFVGKLGVDELREFYGSSRLLVVPSLWFEQFPIVILEAMAHGVPVIASRIGGLPSIIEEGITGSLFEPGNPDALTTAIRYMWDDPQLCLRMGKVGREKAIRQYSRDAYYNNLMEVYQTAIKRFKPNLSAAPIVQISNSTPAANQTGQL